MQVKPIKTKVLEKNNDLFALLDEYAPAMPDRSILAITSKIVSICEGNVLPIAGVDKQAIIKQESDQWLPLTNGYNAQLTIKRNILIPNAGIDESNGNGNFILWPKDPQKSANKIREYLAQKFDVRVGVIITDSKTTPLRWGTTGISLAHSGFLALNNYIGKNDIFGRSLRATQASIADGLAAAAVLVMGEGAEQTPLALITEVPFVEFQDRNPSQAELDALKIDIKDDIYSDLITSANWQKN